MKKLILLFGLAIPLAAQPSNPSIVLVSSPPSGSCANGLPDEQTVITGLLYSCQSGTWTQIGSGGGSGTVNAGTTGQLAYYAASGTTVSGGSATLNRGNLSLMSASENTYAPTTYIAYGDSITACSTVTTVANCYVNHWATDLNLSATNRGTSGDEAADVAWHIQSGDNPAIAAAPNLYSIMIGTNDADQNGVGPTTWEANYKLFHQATISWLGVPATYKAAGSTGTTTGTCANDTTFGFVTGEACTASASTNTISSFSTTGGVFYIWYRSISSDAGTWTYAIDGGSAVAVATAPPINFTTTNGHTSSMGVIRVTGVATGTHSIVFTQTHSGTMSILGVGSVPSTATLGFNALPHIVAADIINQLNGNKLSTTQTYAADAQADVVALQNDGLNVVLAPVNVTVQATTAAADMSNTIHPNDIGHLELYRGFRAPMKETQAYSTPWVYNQASNGALTANIASFTLGSSTGGASYAANVGNTGASGGGSGTINIQAGSTQYATLAYYINASQKWSWGLYENLGKGANMLLYDFSVAKYVLDFPQGMPQDSITGNATGAQLLTVQTNTNCSVNSVSPGACSAAPAGKFVVPTTTTTYTVNTTAVTANSEIFLQPRTDSANFSGSPTCVVPTITADPVISAISAGTSFTLTMTSTSGQTCWTYLIVN